MGSPAPASADPDGPKPVYVQLAEILEWRIEHGRLLPDRPVPSETALRQEFGVARGTARNAIRVLRERGLVTTIQGKGTFVRPKR
jgi:DNA-binding GntR family transcriptional regulator